MKKPINFIFITILLFLGCSSDNSSDNDSETNTPPIELDVSMSISENSLSFDYFENTKSFVITNDGDVSFDWNWADDSSESFLSVTPNSGALSVGESVEVIMTVDRANMVTLTYSLQTFINNNNGQTIPLTVRVENYTEAKWLIEGDVIDAEYDRINDIMVVVSENPFEIRKFNLTNTTVETLELADLPKCVSISQDGNYAVVGHNGSFSYVNLMTMSIENNYPLTTDVFDIIIAPNNWVYVLADDNYEKMRCIDLSNGQELLHQYGSTFPFQSKIKLHPSGNYIYATKEDIVPTDFYKFDITGGRAVYLYDSPYHGEYDFGENIWISENGGLIFAQSKNIFLSNTTSSDMTYVDYLNSGDDDDTSVIQTMDFNNDNGDIYAIFVADPNRFSFQQPDYIVKRYNLSQLSLPSEIELPEFFIDNGSGIYFYKSRGYFGFLNSDGSKFFVLVNIDESSGIENQWAIATIDVL